MPVYEHLLTENVLVLSLYDASANNAVLEAAAAGTPLVMNRLPAVEEVLGADYPLYADTPEAASEALHDWPRLQAAHEHLLRRTVHLRYTQHAFEHALLTALQAAGSRA